MSYGYLRSFPCLNLGSWLVLNLSSLGGPCCNLIYLVPLPTNEPFAFLLHHLPFHFHPQLVCLLAGNGDFVLVGEVGAVEGFGQVLDQHLRDSPLKFLLLRGWPPLLLWDLLPLYLRELLG